GAHVTVSGYVKTSSYKTTRLPLLSNGRGSVLIEVCLLRVHRSTRIADLTVLKLQCALRNSGERALDRAYSNVPPLLTQKEEARKLLIQSTDCGMGLPPL